MTEILDKLFFLIDDWADRHGCQDEETRKLEARQDALQGEIIRRLGEGGQELMETLSGLNLELETIHDQALFRASLRFGAEIVRPLCRHPPHGLVRADDIRPYSTSR